MARKYEYNLISSPPHDQAIGGKPDEHVLQQVNEECATGRWRVRSWQSVVVGGVPSGPRGPVVRHYALLERKVRSDST